MSTDTPYGRTFAERFGSCPVLASPLTGPDTHTKGPARGLGRGEGAHGFGGSIRSIFFRRNNPAIIRNGRASASLRAVVESRLPSQRPRPSPASGSEGPRRVGGRLPSSPGSNATHSSRPPLGGRPQPNFTCRGFLGGKEAPELFKSSVPLL